MKIRCRKTKGFTLLEVLIATAVTLLMMASLAKIFNIIGNSMQRGRAALELNNDLRDVALRLQNDLRNATSVPNPPADPSNAQGYFKYYDGPLTDFTPVLYSNARNTNVNLTNIEDLSRFGDTDDIIMFTARADDVPFTGQVPLFVLQGAAPVTDPTDAAFNLTPVTISSKYAEIVVFAEPVVTSVGNPNLNPALQLADPNNYQTILGSDFPAAYKLHYRTLLIRPDLNLPATGALPFGSGWMVAGPTSIDVDGDGTVDTALPSPTCDMVLPHLQCDLSIRRVVPQDPPTLTSTVAANSLDDLVDPANRFAHVQLELNDQLRTMPILALSPKMDLSDLGYFDSEPGSTGLPTPFNCQSGFLHPAFTLFDMELAGIASPIADLYQRSGEDILADNILAFDVQGFDPGVSLLLVAGANGVPGAVGDDDLNGTVDDASELGWENTDDQILSPNDPSYGAALTSTVAPPVIGGTGGYVDLGWGWKARHQSPAASWLATTVTQGELSGLAAPFDGDPLTESLYRSGQAVQTAAYPAPPMILQHSYDTYSNQYEEDGGLTIEPSTLARGTMQYIPDFSQAYPYASSPAPREAWRRPSGLFIKDASSNGVDDVGTAAGIDDPSELETSPPYQVSLRGVKVTLRMQHSATGQLRQASVSREFVTGN